MFFHDLSTNGLILYFLVYKLPKGPPTFIACLVDVLRCSIHSPITLWTRGGKKNSKRSILVVSDDTYIYDVPCIYNIIYKRSITFQVCSFYCAGDFFFALCKTLYDIKYAILTYMFETFNYKKVYPQIYAMTSLLSSIENVLKN